MGRHVSAVTRLFFKPEGLDVFPGAGAGTLRTGELVAARRATSEGCLPGLACPLASALLEVRGEAEEPVCVQRPGPKF